MEKLFKHLNSSHFHWFEQTEDSYEASEGWVSLQPWLVLLHCYWDVAGTGKFETLLNSKTYQISDRSGRWQGWAGEHMLMQGNKRPLLILEQCHQPRNKVNVATCSMLQYLYSVFHVIQHPARNRAAVSLFWDLWCPQRFLCDQDWA